MEDIFSNDVFPSGILDKTTEMALKVDSAHPEPSPVIPEPTLNTNRTSPALQNVVATVNLTCPLDLKGIVS